MSRTLILPSPPFAAMSPAVRVFFFFVFRFLEGRYVSLGRSYAEDAGCLYVTTKTTVAFLPNGKTDLVIPTMALCGRHIFFQKLSSDTGMPVHTIVPWI
jgi:hypothetical protein